MVKKILSIPNILTSLRIILIAPYICLLSCDGWIYQAFALAIFIISGITDFLDGFLARKMGLDSQFGKFFDPLSDKIFIMSSLVGLLVYYPGIIPLWTVILILIRELAISDFRLVSFTSELGSIKINTALFAKVKTTLLFISIIASNILIMVEKYFGDELVLPKLITLVPTILMVMSIYFAYHSGIVYVLGNVTQNTDSKN